MAFKIELPDDLGKFLQDEVAAKRTSSASDYVTSLLRERISEIAQSAANTSPSASKLNRKEMRKDAFKFLVLTIYWFVAAGVVYFSHRISRYKNLEWFDLSSNAAEFVHEIISPSHILSIVAGPFVAFLLVTVVYILVRNVWFRKTISPAFDRSSETLGEQLYHIVSLIIVFSCVLFVTSKYDLSWGLMIFIFLAVEACLISVFAGSRAA